jgi:hypothetical protein
VSVAWLAEATDMPLVVGVVMAPGDVVAGRRLSASEVENASHDFMLSTANIRKSAGSARVVESGVALVPFTATDAAGRAHSVPLGAWWLAVKTDDPEVVRRVRAGQFSFQPVLSSGAPQAAHRVTPEPTRKEESTMPADPQTAVFTAIRKSALSDRYQGETEEQAVSRYLAEHPSAYQRYRSAAAPVLKSAVPRRMAREEIERLAKREQDINPALSDEQAVRVVMSDRSHRELTQRYRKAHFDAAQPVEPPEVRQSRSEKPSPPVSKASGPAAEIQHIAQALQRSGKAPTYGDALALAARQNPSLYNAYVEAMREQQRAT